MGGNVELIICAISLFDFFDLFVKDVRASRRHRTPCNSASPSRSLDKLGTDLPRETGEVARMWWLELHL